MCLWYFVLKCYVGKALLAELCSTVFWPSVGSGVTCTVACGLWPVGVGAQWALSVSAYHTGQACWGMGGIVAFSVYPMRLQYRGSTLVCPQICEF